jgi:ATP-dependent Clp protease ATP-binding subunit ClpA
LKEQFRPEFLNRLDNIVIFNHLTEAVAKKIVMRELKEVEERLALRNQRLAIDAAVIKKIVAEFKPQEGARSLKRAVQRLIIDTLASKLLNGELATEKSTINAVLKQNDITFQ